MRVRDPGTGSRWLLLLGLALLSAAAASPLEQADRDPGTLVVGDLKLADRDEGPSDGVSGTFRAANLVPGETSTGRLTLLREPFQEGVPPAMEPRVELGFQLDEPSALATVLHVVELRYGDQDLRDQVEAGCGTPLTLQRLARCTERQRHPLSTLPDPTPEGRDLVLGVELGATASNEHQGKAARFTVDASLKAMSPIDAPSPPEAPPARTPHGPCASVASSHPLVGGLTGLTEIRPSPVPSQDEARPPWPQASPPGLPSLSTLLATHLADACSPPSNGPAT